jgi:hypothetical protein
MLSFKITIVPKHKLLITNQPSRKINCVVEYTGRKNGLKYNVGIGYELARYYNKSRFAVPFGTVNYETKFVVHKYSLFSQVSKSVFKERLALSLGVRFDGNSYNSSMANIVNQVSPRFSSSLSITKDLRWNTNVGYYHQLPQYTAMGLQRYKWYIGEQRHTNLQSKSCMWLPVLTFPQNGTDDSL